MLNKKKRVLSNGSRYDLKTVAHAKWEYKLGVEKLLKSGLKMLGMVSYFVVTL